MNSNEYRKRIEKYVILENYLTDILSYTSSALTYLNSDNKSNLNIDEIIMHLSCIPEIIEEIEQIINEMEVKFNEQL